jgi:hypothetical protein
MNALRYLGRPSFAREGGVRRVVVGMTFAVSAACLLLASFSHDAALMASAAMLLPIVVLLAWQPGAVPVLAFVAVLHWFEVTLPVVSSSLAGIPVEETFVTMKQAAWMGLAGVLVLALGMRLGQGRQPPAHVALLREDAALLSPKTLAIAYMGAALLGSVALAIGYAAPGLRQPLLPLAHLRAVVVTLILCGSLLNASLRKLAIGIVVLEVLIGFGGFFADFKHVLFLALIVYAGLSQRRRISAGALLLAVATFLLLLFWQVVKADYRHFVSRGGQQQVVLVSVPEQVAFFAGRIASLSWKDLVEGLETGVERLSYLDFFARSIQQVPGTLPYQNGRLWGEALQHVFTPRLLFPEKPSIEDSERVREFSGVWVAGAESGTSISIGYFGESYIDFGPAGMLVPILLVGVGLGLTYRVFARPGPHMLVGLAIAVNVLLGAGTSGTSNLKLLGGTLTTVVTFGFLLWLFGDRLWRYLTAPERGRAAAAGAARFQASRAGSTPPVATLE